MKNLKSERVGLIFKTNEGYTFEVVEYESSNDITVEFNCGNKITTRWDHIQNGLIKYANHKSNCGVGFIGFGKHSSVSSKDAYRRWDKMLSRSYRKECKGYENCSVSDEWHNFQTFAKWFYSQKDSLSRDINDKLFCLDKDILGDGLSYGEHNCCFVPESLNKILTNTKNAKGAYKNGDVFMVRTRLSGVVGNFETEEEATMNYKKTKIKDILSTVERESFKNELIISKLLEKFE